MACAVDFTLSNGEPLTQDSLHTNDEERVSSRFVKVFKRVLKGGLFLLEERRKFTFLLSPETETDV